MDQSEQAEIEDHLRHQIGAYHEAALIFAAIKTGIPDALSTGPKAVDGLADELGLSAPHLRRFLLGLVTMRICEELADDRFELTAVGQSLAPGSKSNLREKALVVVGQYWQPWLDLSHCLKTGEPSFPKVFGKPVAEWRRANKEEGAAFETYLAKEDASGGGDTPLPADAQILNAVLQQHDDAGALAILETCREAMGPTSKLIIIERLLPECATDDPAAIMADLHMMTISGGRARTRQEMEALLASAGFSVTKITATDEGLALIEAHKA